MAKTKPALAFEVKPKKLHLTGQTSHPWTPESYLRNEANTHSQSVTVNDKGHQKCSECAQFKLNKNIIIVAQLLRDNLNLFFRAKTL